MFKELINHSISKIVLNPAFYAELQKDVQVLEDFIYVESGLLHFQLDNGKLFCIGNLNHTNLGTDHIGVKEIELDHDTPYFSKIPSSIANYLNRIINKITISWTRDDITNPHSESCAENISIQFEDGKLLIIFCGEFEESANGYDLVPGHPALLLFTDRHSFNKYAVSPVLTTETIQ